MKLLDSDALTRAETSDHGVLCTLHPTRGVDAVPACFVIDGDVVAVPIDSLKPKSSATLQRVRNLERDPRATLLCERWEPRDWSRLWWVRLGLVRSDESDATRSHCAAELGAKYPQYAERPFASILTFRITGIAGWAAAANET